jgi:uncharacterized protein
MSIRVTQINIYPVKGLAGIALPSSGVTTRGLKYDRRFMVIDRDHEFLTQRELPKMATVWTELIAGQIELVAPDREPVAFDAEPVARPTRTVRVWSSHVHAHTVSAAADEWLSDYLGVDARLVYMPESTERLCSPAYAKNGEIVSFADGYPVLIAAENSLADLNARIVAAGGTAVPMNRFRANVVVRDDGAAATPWAEDSWGDFAIGKARFRAVKPCSRCQVTTTDQASGEVRGPEPLRTLSTFRAGLKGPLFGVNLVPAALGDITIGDALTMT